MDTVAPWHSAVADAAMSFAAMMATNAAAAEGGLLADTQRAAVPMAASKRIMLKGSCDQG
jgi:hypothetical protein